MNRETKIIDKKTGRVQNLGRLINLYGKQTVIDKWQKRYNLAINGYQEKDINKMTKSLIKQYNFNDEKAGSKVARYYKQYGTLRHPDQFTAKGVLRKNYKQMKAQEEFEAEIQEIETKPTRIAKLKENIERKQLFKKQRQFLKNVKNLHNNANFDINNDPITAEKLNLKSAMYIEKNALAGNKHIYNPETLKQCLSTKREYEYRYLRNNNGQIVFDQVGYPITRAIYRNVPEINSRTQQYIYLSPFTRRQFCSKRFYGIEGPYSLALPSNTSRVRRVKNNPLYTSAIRYRTKPREETSRIFNNKAIVTKYNKHKNDVVEWNRICRDF